MKKFWICKICLSSASVTINYKFSGPKMKSCVINGLKILLPSDNIENEDLDIDIQTHIFIPKNCSALQNRKPDNFPLFMYGMKDLNNRMLSSHYEKRLNKFYQRKVNCDTYEGTITDNENKKLSSINPIIDDSSIRGSDSWKTKKMNSIFSCFEQYGQIAIGFNFKIKFDNIETISTLLLSAGKVITLEYVGNIYNEFKTKYFMHNHNDNVQCNESCVIQELLDLNVPFCPKYIPTYLCSVFQKQNALIENFFKNKNFLLHSEDFYVGIDFYLDGIASINGIIWPLHFGDINKKLSECSFNGDKLDSDLFLEYIDKTILATSNPLAIVDHLHISYEEALIIHQHAIDHQIFVHSCDDLYMPSFESLLTRRPPLNARENIMKGEEFLDVEKQYILNLSIEEKENLTALEWFNRLENCCKFELIYNETFLEVQINEKNIIFKMEEELSKYIEKYGYLIGLHHYCLRCNDIENNVVLRRTMILDCFTVPYNDILLKAFNGYSKIVPIYGINDWWQFQDQFMPKYPNFNNPDLIKLLESHKLVHLTEFLSLSDPNKMKDIFSAPIEFVSTYMARKTIFRKIDVRNEESYNYPGRGHFEVLSSNTMRHFNRLNGKELLLAESVLWYDALSKKESLEIMQLYKEKIEKIPVGDIIGIYNKALPIYLLSENNKVMKLRKNRKVLKIPQFLAGTPEYKFAKIMLYYPLAPKTEIDKDRLGKSLIIS